VNDNVCNTFGTHINLSKFDETGPMNISDPFKKFTQIQDKSFSKAIRLESGID
jgi:hypothetical protein